jgi:hypothetical protein
MLLPGVGTPAARTPVTSGALGAIDVPRPFTPANR